MVNAGSVTSTAEHRPPGDLPRGWEEAPDLPATAGRADRLAALPWDRLRPLGAVVVAVTGPTLRTLAISPAPGPVVVGAVGIAGTIWGGRSTVPWQRAASAVACGAIATPFGGVWVGIWLALAMVLAWWSVLGRSPWGHHEVPVVALGPVVALSAVAAVIGRDLFDRHRPVALTAVALAVTALAGRFPEAARAAPATIGRAAGRVVARVSFLLLGLGVVLVPWAVGRLVVADPLDPPRRGPSMWIPRQRMRARATHPWATPDHARGRPRLRTARRLVGSLALSTLLVFLAVDRARPARPDPLRLGPSTPAAFADAPWWPRYEELANWVFFDPGRVYDPLRYPPMRDVRSPYINIDDGERRTWRAPECDCRRITLWMYGGSTTLGLGQRDDHTIASALARRAAEDGIALDVRNRGVLGDLHWEEAQRFEWDVAVEPAPDLVAFYSGVNDLTGAQYRATEGPGLDRWPVDMTAEVAMDYFRTAPDPFGIFERWFPPAVPDEIDLPPRTRPARPGADALGTHVGEQYRTARDIAARAAASAEVDAVWFWQPARFSRPPVAGEPQREPDDERYQRTAYGSATAAATAGGGVEDLSDVFDDVAGPVFYDDVHTNEAGAALVAEAIYRRLAPRLRELDGGP